MNAPRRHPLLTASGLLLAACFAPLTGSAQQASGQYFVSPNQKPVFPPSTETRDGPPSMTKHVIALLFNATQLAPDTVPLDQKIAAALGLGADTAVLSLGHDPVAGGAEHFFAVSRASERKEVVIFHVLEDGSTEAFLCDFSGRLRGAVVVKADGTVRKAGIWRSAGKFKAELSVIGNEVRANSKRYVHYILAGR